MVRRGELNDAKRISEVVEKYWKGVIEWAVGENIDLAPAFASLFTLELQNRSECLTTDTLGPLSRLPQANRLSTIIFSLPRLSRYAPIRAQAPHDAISTLESRHADPISAKAEK